MPEYYIGLMSGTSMDAVDAVLVDASRHLPIVSRYLTTPIPTKLRTRLIALAQGDAISLKQLAELDVLLGNMFADAALALLQQSGIPAQSVQGVGSHGQTIFHRPDGPFPTSMQIGDPNIIAERTGITTIADFRR